MIDRIVNSMLRGFGWTLGRRAANRVPLWLVVVGLLVLYVIGGGR